MDRLITIYLISFTFYHPVVPEQTSLRGKVLLEKDIEETRVRPISGVDHVTVDLIILHEVC